MGLSIETLRLTNFRNFNEKTFVFDKGITLLIGPNATGKTNTIEALQLITTGSSFRHPRLCDLSGDKEISSFIQSHVTGDGRVVDLLCLLTPTKKSFQKNTKPCTKHDIIGLYPSVLFYPDNLLVIKGSAKKRRDELDLFGSNIHKGYDNVVRTYMRTVTQRNTLLKDGYCSDSLINAWNESLAFGGATLLQHRLNLFSQLMPKVKEIYHELAQSETLDIVYESTITEDIFSLSREQIQEAFFSALEKNYEEDKRRQQTLVGPHRDDICFYINNKPARTFGSQGQQRSIVLAWKMAEIEVTKNLIKTTPLLLLDDVMSELDIYRREALLNFISRGVQTIITSTNAEPQMCKQINPAQVIRYGE